MAQEKRTIGICLCGASRTRNGSGKWICDRAGTACPGHDKPLTTLYLTPREQEIVKEQKEKAKRALPVAPAAPVLSAPIIPVPMNPTERWAMRNGK